MRIVFILLLMGGSASVLLLLGWVLRRLDRARGAQGRRPYAFDAIDSADAAHDRKR